MNRTDNISSEPSIAATSKPDSIGSWSIGRTLKQGAATIRSSGSDSAELDARVLLGDVLGMTWSDMIAGRDSQVDEAHAKKFDELVTRRARGEPVAYLIGRKEFWGLDFDVNSSTLIPRPDSETLVETALHEVRQHFELEKQQLNILDLGTGSGCLLLSILSELPTAHGVGVDRDSTALDVAQKNAIKLGLQNRARFYKSDWGSNVEGFFNLIVVNPPYIADRDFANLARDVYQFEPRGALCGGPDGLEAYRTIVKDIRKLLVPNGIICVEIGAGQADSIRRILFDQSELMFLKSKPDLAGTIRVLAGQKRNIEKGVGKGSATR